MRLAQRRFDGPGNGNGHHVSVMIRAADDALTDSLIGFLQRSRCLAEVRENGAVAVFLPHDLPDEVEHAEVESYLRLWERTSPGAVAELLGETVG